MNFWKVRDLALLKLRQEAIEIINEFERKNPSGSNPEKINRLINKELGNKIKFLVGCSLNQTLKNIDFSQNRNI